MKKLIYILLVLGLLVSGSMAIRWNQISGGNVSENIDVRHKLVNVTNGTAAQDAATISQLGNSKDDIIVYKSGLNYVSEYKNGTTINTSTSAHTAIQAALTVTASTDFTDIVVYPDVALSDVLILSSDYSSLAFRGNLATTKGAVVLTGYGDNFIAKNITGPGSGSAYTGILIEGGAATAKFSNINRYNVGINLSNSYANAEFNTLDNCNTGIYFYNTVSSLVRFNYMESGTTGLYFDGGTLGQAAENRVTFGVINHFTDGVRLGTSTKWMEGNQFMGFIRSCSHAGIWVEPTGDNHFTYFTGASDNIDHVGSYDILDQGSYNWWNMYWVRNANCTISSYSVFNDLYTSAYHMYGGVNTAIDLSAYEGSIELSNPSQGQHIDFKNSYSEDFDGRILYTEGSMNFYIGGVLAGYIDATGWHNA